MRKKIQRKNGKENRLLFKHSKKVLTMRRSKLKPEQAEKVEYLLYFNDEKIKRGCKLIPKTDKDLAKRGLCFVLGIFCEF